MAGDPGARARGSSFEEAALLDPDEQAGELDCLAAGGRVVWVVDPGPQRVLVFTPPNAVRVLGPDDTVDGGEVLPGFSAKVAELVE